MIGDLSQALPALQGFFTIGVLIGVGWLLAGFGVLSVAHRQMMSHIALYVASPALMFATISQADLSHVFAWSIVASYGAVMVAGGVGVFVARRWFHHGLAESTMS
ncbi:MAG: hypothetical protein LBV00_05060, partial [Propionibacteriaceae bacterium]|nr:hypothetical protein [Propionibacteriaceae bacterium]